MGILRVSVEDRVYEILSRHVPLNALGALVGALDPSPNTVDLSATAIAFDSSVFLRIGNHPKREDIIDYLSSGHSAPLILPGQTIQEFWNNQLVAVDTVGASLRKKYDQLKNECSKVDLEFGDFNERFQAILSDFSTEHGYIYEEGTLRKTLSLLDLLEQKALVPFGKRERFFSLGAHRKKTKTPPGFKDDGDGDFFVWVDFLVGLEMSRRARKKFQKAALVIQDRKIDWSREGTAHPILVAEVEALVGVPFELWTIQQLSDEIGKAT